MCVFSEVLYLSIILIIHIWNSWEFTLPLVILAEIFASGIKAL